MPYGDVELALRLPSEWVGEFVSPRELPGGQPVDRMILAALEYPISSLPLKRIAKPGQRVAVMVDDHTRKTPIRQMLPFVLDQLHVAGVEDRDISIVVALGSHRGMTSQEAEAKIGSPILNRYQVINLPVASAGDRVMIGNFGSQPAGIHRAVAEADLRIGLGMITPHMDAGFSGGSKIILPGACSDETVDAFHVRSVDLPGNPLGDIHAPLRLELEQFVAEHVPLSFILNAVTYPDGKAYQCVAGHPVAAHRLGVEYARQAYGVPVKRRYPVVVADCYPYDLDLWQSMKGLWCGELLTEDGGTLILLTRAGERLGGYNELPGYIGMNPVELQRLMAIGEATHPKEAATGVMVGRMKHRINIALVSDGFLPEDALRMGLAYFGSLEEAISSAVQRLTENERQGCVAVLSHAGTLLPLLPESEKRAA